MLHIMFFLHPRDLFHLAAVSKALRRIASDNTFWRSILRREMVHWSCISHATLPGHNDIYCAAKKAYLRGSPACNTNVLCPPPTTTRVLSAHVPFLRKTHKVRLE